jgi:hypothetical protein
MRFHLIQEGEYGKSRLAWAVHCAGLEIGESRNHGSGAGCGTDGPVRAEDATISLTPLSAGAFVC